MCSSHCSRGRDNHRLIAALCHPIKEMRRKSICMYQKYLTTCFAKYSPQQHALQQQRRQTDYDQQLFIGIANENAMEEAELQMKA